MKFLIANLLFACLPPVVVGGDFQLEIHQANPEVSFRAIKVSPSGTVIIGGTGGTLIRSDDQWKTWQSITVPDSETLDFRDVEFVTGGEWVLMSAGPGERSRIFRSTDNGSVWAEVHRNRHPDGFYNGIALRPDGTGLAIGDPLDGRLTLLKTEDSGQTWNAIDGPLLTEGEYGFAASGSGIIFGKDHRALIATGGSKARVLTSKDVGQTWKIVATDIRQGTASSGIFSIAEHSTGRAVVVGGDYKNPQQATDNYAFRATFDGTWETGRSALPHKACVKFLSAERVLCVGRTGIAVSNDSGRSWKAISNESFYTFDVHRPTGDVYLAGANGRMARLRFLD